MATGFGAMITRERLGERSSRFKAAVGMAAWKTLELRSHEFHRSVAVVTLSEGDTRSEDIFLELAQFHDHIYTIDCYRWLDIHGTHRIRGCERVLQLGSQLFPGVHLKWILGERFKDETSGLAGRVDIPSRLTMVNIPWLTAYLLLVAVEGKAIKTHDPASRAKELLRHPPDSGVRAGCRVPVTNSGAIGEGDDLDSFDPVGLKARAAGVQAFAISSVAGVASMVVRWCGA